MSGSFGSGSGGNFTFGQTPATTQAVSLFGSNAPAAATGFAFGSGTGTTFGKPQPTSQPTSFSFASPVQSSSAFGFGSQPTQQTASFATQPAAPTAFGGQPQATPFGAPTGLNFGGGSVFNAQPTAAPVLGFGSPAQTATSFGGFTASTPATTGQTGFTFGSLASAAAAATTAPAVTFGQPTAANQLTGSSLFKTGAPIAPIAPTPQVENQIYGAPNVVAPVTTAVSGLSFGAMTQPGGFRANVQPTSTGFGAPVQPTFGAMTQPSSIAFGATTQPGSVSFGATTQPSLVSFGAPVQPSTVTFGAPVQPTTVGFGTPVQQSTVSFGTPTQPASVAFGAPTQPAGFGSPAPVQANAASIFGHVASETTTAAAPPVFGQSLVAAPMTTPAPTPTATPSMFGVTTQSAPAIGAGGAAAPVYQFGTPISSVSTSVPGTGSGLATSFAGLSGGIKLGGATPVMAQTATPPLTAVGAGTMAVTPVASTVAATAATTPIPGFSFPTLAKTSAPTTTSEAATSFNITGSGTATSASAVSVASTSGFSLPSITSIGSTASSLTGLATSVATTTAVSSAAASSGMNFRQLEETINKWTVELEEQEKIYLNQATQVNAWDRMLIKNGETITHLNDSLERVKLEQQHLEHEIDFILAQQKELEDLLSPLEQHVDQTPTLSVQQHADLEREHTYQLAENIDAQMKRMAEDLKEIIDHVNASNNNQDNTDPVYQVGKILNAHMDSLQWIEQNTNLVQRKLEEVSQLYEVRRKDQERRFRLAYE